MCNKYMSRLFFKRGGPAHKTFIVCMAADSGHSHNFRIYFNILTKQTDFRCPFQKCPTKRTNCLISHKYNG